jgi:hypothetical protein
MKVLLGFVCVFSQLAFASGEIKLVDYVGKHGGDVAHTVSLVENLLRSMPPSVVEPSKSDCYHDVYRSKQAQLELAKVIALIFGREREMTKRSSRYHLLPRGLTGRELDQARFKSYLHKQALSFAVYQVGNCSHRSCFSAINLAKALTSTNVRVTVFSFAARDQYVVLLTDKVSTLIYDPLTNPEAVYQEDFYKKNILKFFGKKPKAARAPVFNYDVSGEESLYFAGVVENHIKKEAVDFGTVADIVGDIRCALSMMNNSSPFVCRFEVGKVREDLSRLSPKALDILNSARQRWLKTIDLPLYLYKEKTTHDTQVISFLKSSGLDFVGMRFFNTNEDLLVDAVVELTTDVDMELAKSIQERLGFGGFYRDSNGLHLFVLESINQSEFANKIQLLYR